MPAIAKSCLLPNTISNFMGLLVCCIHSPLISYAYIEGIILASKLHRRLNLIISYSLRISILHNLGVESCSGSVNTHPISNSTRSIAALSDQREFKVANDRRCISI